MEKDSDLQSNSDPIQAGEMIVSMPTQTEDISRPSRGMQINLDERRAHPQGNLSALSIVIYFQDKQGINLKIEDGQNAEAGEIFDIVTEEMRYSKDAKYLFSLWLVSDLLEVQLKPNQIPFRIVCYWEELLRQYTDHDATSIERDEPVLMFQRNVYCNRNTERTILNKNNNEDLLRLIFHEAKENIVDARYPLSLQKCEELAAVQALIANGPFEEGKHTAEFYKSNINDYFPPHHCKKKKKAFFGLGKQEVTIYEKLALKHSNATKHYKNADLFKLYHVYMKSCYDLPYYGAAFFRGQIEHPNTSVMKAHEDDPIFVAINTEWVCIIDMDDVIFLVGLTYEEMKWDFTEPDSMSSRNCLPCLYLQFPARDSATETHVSKVLQIFSREAKLMNGLIASCKKLRQSQPVEERVDTRQLDAADGCLDGIIESGAKTWENFNRLCLTTFDRNGKKLDSNVRIPKNKKT